MATLPNVKELFAAKTLPLPDGYSHALCAHHCGLDVRHAARSRCCTPSKR